MSLKIVYFPIPGRIEPARLALVVGGQRFEDERLTGEQWATLKPKIAPKQLPLIYVGEESVSQSFAILRYTGKVALYEGKPLYPTCPLEALKVDEFIDFVAEIYHPINPTFTMTDPEEIKAARAKLVTDDGVVTKWMKYIDELLGNSSSGFAVGDSLTIADLAVFGWVQPFRSGWMEGFPKDCLDKYSHIMKHAEKIANIPLVKEYYKDAKGVEAVFKARM
eukprot:TRINITY_DN622_c0_g1_i2.p1 TRINITY_DN622_c0_g1~~TRINITY_DN622_c0_g1_i2.p1  ORF type:complete len:238 (+),score=62.38 TRINITY_DN622_c0_g1_i2:53-715(+)